MHRTKNRFCVRYAACLSSHNLVRIIPIQTLKLLFPLIESMHKIAIYNNHSKLSKLFNVSRTDSADDDATVCLILMNTSWRYWSEYDAHDSRARAILQNTTYIGRQAHWSAILTEMCASWRVRAQKSTKIIHSQTLLHFYPDRNILSRCVGRNIQFDVLYWVTRVKCWKDSLNNSA